MKIKKKKRELQHVTSARESGVPIFLLKSSSFFMLLASSIFDMAGKKDPACEAATTNNNSDRQCSYGTCDSTFISYSTQICGFFFVAYFAISRKKNQRVVFDTKSFSN